MNPGEIYWADLSAGRRPVIIVSREPLNRGAYVVAVLCTTARVEQRAKLPNCVSFGAGEFGLPKDCVAQCETVTFLDRSDLDEVNGMIGILDAARLRAVVQAIGNVIGAECEPL
jgi:mRNA-degrading endonuclease toxin of MazEF toxin-antitoxin module